MVINIKEWVDERKKEIAEQNNNSPSLLILQLDNEDYSSDSYTKTLVKDMQECKIDATVFKTTNSDKMVNFVKKAMIEEYDAVMVQNPWRLPEDVRNIIFSNITPKQDVDGLTENSLYEPCTPCAIMEIIKNWFPKKDLKGIIVAVVGKGELVGKPLVPMLMDQGATIISCNSQTKDIPALTRQADIVISATGCEYTIMNNMVKDGAFVVDAGFSRPGMGDCDPCMYENEKIAITSVPGGVGLMTRLMLIQNVIKAAK